MQITIAGFRFLLLSNSVSDDSLVITDATQGSARVLKAVQDAIKDIK